MNYNQYQAFPPIDLPNRQWPNKQVTYAPTWCAVDLRDGNQSLPNPMGVEEKLRFFQLLCQIGFKEIEIGFPAASETEFTFCRKLIEENLIPEDVTIQVLVQARENLISKTFEALKGCSRAIVHLYNSTNPAQRKIVFDLSKTEIIDLAIAATKKIVAEVKARPETIWTLQYSPESFSMTELPMALAISNAVSTLWLNETKLPFILNLPATVEASTPNIYADQIEWMSRFLSHREQTVLSVHTHNDRGTGVAATELALLAGAQRVEGTLFGNGERTGNVDIVTLALNLHTQGINCRLNLQNLPSLVKAYEEATHMQVNARHPYAGELVFTAFSGSHQDAIAKGLRIQKEGEPWRVPYLPINPADIGREYERAIRYNSQSGKGGIIHILQTELGLQIPKACHPEIGSHFKEYSDFMGREITADEITAEFHSEFVNNDTPWKLISHQTRQVEGEETSLEIILKERNEFHEKTVTGNGPLHALATYIGKLIKEPVEIELFEEHAASPGAEAQAIAYINLQGGKLGIGIDSNIETAALKALVCATNRTVT